MIIDFRSYIVVAHGKPYVSASGYLYPSVMKVPRRELIGSAEIFPAAAMSRTAISSGMGIYTDHD